MKRVVLSLLLNPNKRDVMSLVGWFFVSLMAGILSLPTMVGREVYQWKHYHLTRFEWEDMVRYGCDIAVGALLHYYIIFLIVGEL